MDGFQEGEWRAQFSTWQSSCQQRRDQFSRITLKILLWGPGEHAPDFEKRKQIGEHLRKENPNNDVATSEELLRWHPELYEGLDTFESEEMQWRDADIVFALIPRSKRVTGVKAELVAFGRHPSFIRKACLIVPKLTGEKARRLGLLDLGWYEMPTTRRMEYSPAQYRDCSEIRAFCSRAVVAVRNRKGLEQLRAAEGRT